MYCFCEITEVPVVRSVRNEHDPNGKGMVKETVVGLRWFYEYLPLSTNGYYWYFFRVQAKRFVRFQMEYELSS